MAQSIEAGGFLHQDLKRIRRSHGLLAKTRRFLHTATGERRREERDLVNTHFAGEDAPENPWNKPFTTYRLRRGDLPRGCIGREVHLAWSDDLVKVVLIGEDKVTGRVEVVDKGFSYLPQIRIPTY